MTRIFISYSRTDRPFVDEFVPLLRRVYADAVVWFDEAIPGGHQWWQVIVNEITRCDLFIFLLSNESLGSPYCQEEFRHALRLHKPYLPVTVRSKTQIDDKVPDDLRGVLRQTQYVDLSGGLKDYQATAALYAALNSLLREIPPAAPASVYAQPVREPSPPARPLQRPPSKRSLPAWVLLLALVLIGACVLVTALAVFPDILGEIGANPPTRGPTATTGIVGGFEGYVADSGHGLGIPGVRITFEAEDGSYTDVVVADDRGVYQIDLPVGRYRVTATHEDYETYSTGTGFFVVRDSSIQHGDITMVHK